MRDKTLHRTFVGFLLGAGVLLLSGCVATPTNGPRPAGPFDAGQNGLPETADMDQICGADTRHALTSVSNAYIEISGTWSRFKLYSEAVLVDKVTVEELAGATQRYDSIALALDGYAQAADDARVVGGEVGGTNAAECDKLVLLVFEQIFQARAEEIQYVTDASKKLLTKLTKNQTA